MPSASLAPYQSNSVQMTFTLQSSNSSGAAWLVTARPLANPYKVELIRKIAPPNSMANDHVILRVSRTDANSTSGKPATGSASLDISIPRDVATIDLSEMKAVVGILSSLLNDNAALAATDVNRSALLSGLDL